MRSLLDLARLSPAVVAATCQKVHMTAASSRSSPTSKPRRPTPPSPASGAEAAAAVLSLRVPSGTFRGTAPLRTPHKTTDLNAKTQSIATKHSEAQPPAVVAAANTSTATAHLIGNDDHLPTAAEQAALLDAFLACGCVHPTDVRLTPAETAAVLAALKADPDVLAMAPDMHSRLKRPHYESLDRHRDHLMSDKELDSLSQVILKALRSVKPILQFTESRQEAAVAAMKAIVMEAPEFESTETQQRMTAHLSKAVQEAQRSVKPIMLTSKTRQEQAVKAMSKTTMEAMEFDNTAVAERMMAHFATWVPESDLLKLKQALEVSGSHGKFADDVREHASQNDWGPEGFILDKLEELISETCPHLAADWSTEWKEFYPEDDNRKVKQLGTEECVALLRSFHQLSTEDIWRHRCINFYRNDNRTALKALLGDRFVLNSWSENLERRFVRSPNVDRLVDVVSSTAEGRAFVAALDSGCVGIIAGESGSGKSITAAMVAARPDDAAPAVGKNPRGLVIILSASDIFDSDRFSREPSKTHLAKIVQTRAVERVLYYLGLTETSRLKACGARVTVIFEQAGEYLTSVRMLCVVREAVRRRLMNVLRVRDVQFICEGTGVDMPTRAWAAPPDAYHQIHVRPFLWPHLCEAFKDNEKTTPALRRMFEIIADGRHDHHRLVWLRVLLENARYAAVFSKMLDDASRTNYDQPGSDSKGRSKRDESSTASKFDESTMRVLSAAFADSSPDDVALIAAVNILARQALAEFFKRRPRVGSESEAATAQVLRKGLKRLLNRTQPPDDLVDWEWMGVCERYGILTCPSRCIAPAAGSASPTTDDPIADVPLLLPVDEAAAAAHANGVESPPTHQVTVAIAPEPLLQVLSPGRAFLHVSAASAAMFLMLLQRDSPTDVRHPPAARALLLALTDYAAVCASLAALAEERAVAPITAGTAAARGVPALRRIIDGLGVPEVRDGPSKGMWGFNVPLATLHVAGKPIDHHTVPAAGGAGSEVLDAAFEAYAKAATRPGDRHAVVIVNHPTAEHAPLLVVGPTQLVLLHAVTGRLAPDVVAGVLRAVVPLCAVNGAGRPHYHQAKQQGAAVPDPALFDARCCAQRQRTTEALVERAAGVQLRPVAKYDRKKKAAKRCRDDVQDEGTASTADDSSPVEELARMPAADTTAVDFTVDTVVVYEGAAAPEMALAADGQCEHPDVGGSELLVQYTKSNGTAFVVRYRYFVLDVTWRREGGRTGPLHDDEPLPPLYPVHQTAFAASE